MHSAKACCSPWYLEEIVNGTGNVASESVGLASEGLAFMSLDGGALCPLVHKYQCVHIILSEEQTYYTQWARKISHPGNMAPNAQPHTKATVTSGVGAAVAAGGLISSSSRAASGKGIRVCKSKGERAWCSAAEQELAASDVDSLRKKQPSSDPVASTQEKTNPSGNGQRERRSMSVRRKTEAELRLSLQTFASDSITKDGCCRKSIYSFGLFFSEVRSLNLDIVEKLTKIEALWKSWSSLNKEI